MGPARHRMGHVRVRLVMYAIVAGAVLALVLQGWYAERQAAVLANEARIANLAGGQRMHSQRIGRLAAMTSLHAGDEAQRAEMQVFVRQATDDAELLESLVGAQQREAGRYIQTVPGAMAAWRAAREALDREVATLLAHDGPSPVQALSRAADGVLAAAQRLVEALAQDSREGRLLAARDATTHTTLVIVALIGFGALAVEPAAQAVRRQQERLLAQARELRVAAIAFESSEAIAITDSEQRILRVNSAFARITGYGADEAIGVTPGRLLKSGRHGASFYDALWRDLQRDQRWQGEIWNRRKNGEQFPEWLSITAVTDDEGEVTNYVVVFSDITQRKQAEETIHQLAFYDALTELPNRRLLRDRLSHTVEACRRHRRVAALLFLDLDNFKVLNDTQGHDVGDLLLVEVARRLVSTVRTIDTVARHGGDEFVIVLDELGAPDEAVDERARAVAEKVRAAVSEPFMLRGLRFQTTPSIGICMIDSGEALSVDELLKRADTAMYQAKRDGRNAACFYDAGTHSAMQARVALEADLRQALPQRQFELHFQRQVDGAGVVIGAEVLLRWQHPVRGPVPPGEFIAVAEDSELIVDIGQWVLEHAAQVLHDWAGRAETAHLRLAVNVSPRQFRRTDFVARVRRALDRAGARAERLEIELTEGLVLQDVGDAAAKMAELKTLGVRFSIDDFGTQHSSLSYLARLPLDQLKIDQSFVRGAAQHTRQAVVVRTIIGMGRNLNLDVVAEGVESAEQHRFLLANGCGCFQGYLFGRPMPLAAFEASLAPRALVV